MSCPDIAVLGKNLTFTITAKDGTGAPADADGDVSYSVYEDETGTAIVSDTMAKLDDAGTTGFYSEQLAISTANGYERFKTYTILITAAVSGVDVSKSYSFTVVAESTATSIGGGQTLSDLKDICIYNGWNDTTTAGDTQLEYFIQHTLLQLCELMPWPEYYYNDGSAAFTSGTDYKALTTGITKVGSVIRATRSMPLDEVDMNEYLRRAKYHAGSGVPDYYSIDTAVSSGDIQLTMYVYPNPSADITLYFTYYKPPSSVSEWPNNRVWLLIEALKARLAAKDRDSGGYALYSVQFQDMLNRAYKTARPSMLPFITNPPAVGKWKLRDIEKEFAV